MSEAHLSRTKEYYDKRFGSQSQHLNEEETIRWRAIQEQLEKMNLHSDSLIVDFGCGRGWLSNNLSAYGKVTGCDVSAGAIKNAQLSFPSINFVCLDATGEIPPSLLGKFDLLVSSEVIEHIEDQSAYLQNMALLLKPSGLFLITTPNGKWFETFYSEGRETWKQPVENWLAEEKLLNALRKVEFEITNLGTFNAEWLFSQKPSSVLAILSKPLSRKILKAFSLFTFILQYLNKNKYGLNLIVTGNRLHG